MNNFFGVEPYKSYSEYFNVYMVGAVSEQSGIGDIAHTVNNRFGTRFQLYERMMQTNTQRCYQYAGYAPISSPFETTIIHIANTSVWGGTCYWSTDGRAVAICAYDSEFRYTVQHEGGGHGFAKLADEYVEGSNYRIPQSDIDELKWLQSTFGYYANVDITDNLSNIRWKHFIGLPNYSYVGAYEGGYYYERGYGDLKITVQ